MNTVTCTTPDGKIRYYLADNQGTPVPEVMNYLKFLDNQGKARNTLRLSCYQLQNYYRFLEKAEKDYRDVTIDDTSANIIKLIPRDNLTVCFILTLQKREEQARNPSNPAPLLAPFS